MESYNFKDNGIKIALLIILFSASLILSIQSVDAADALPKLPPKINPKIDPGRIKQRLQSEEELTSPDAFKSGETLEQTAGSVSALPKSEEDAKFKLSEVAVSGVTVYKKGELSQYYHSYLVKDVSLNDLQDIANAITNRYRKDGYIISRAVVPAQDIVSGKVGIQVIEGYISTVYIEGKAGKVQAKIEKYGEEIKKMRPLQGKKLERYLLILSDIYGLEVKTVLSPATSALGAAELTIVIEQQRVSAVVNYDNRGSRYMGPNQVTASVIASDVIFGADYFSVQTIDTPYTNELRYVQLNYNSPLGMNGLRINVEGGFTETKPGFFLKDLDMIGRGKAWGIKLEYPLLRTRTKNVWLYGKFDWLDTYTNYNFVKPLFKDHIRSARFGVSYDFIDAWRGTNLIGLDMSKGLHIFGASPLNPETPLTRDKGLSDYKKVNMN